MDEWSKEQYTSFMENGSTGLVYFYTPLCGTCQVASKMLLVISELMPVLSIGKLNANYVPDLAQSLSVESVPSLLFVKDGEALEKIYAFHSVPYLVEKIKKMIY
ncbi:thioredoxin family protein [Neobacillus terrae]|uniref:thioredoxin family protein n=1 Tax=Neobacillus terrae TaxID=3034837 RepID=UPI00140CF441|nr:thioredoxin family protein [Neobacillus terrae]NHM32768.1 thioredoxin family protein [Neobacillus terrae]